MRAFLSDREQEVLEQAARGLTASESARESHYSPETVKAHRRAILHKLGAHNMTEAVAIAKDEGYL